MTADILCLGEPLVEFVRQADGRYLRGFGGDTSNAAIAAARQGAKVGYLTVLGADRFGDAIMGLWASEGVDSTYVRRDPDAPTGIYFVDPDPAARHFTYYRAGSAASLMQPEHLPVPALQAAKALHLSGISLAVSPGMRASAFAAMAEVAGAGGSVSVDTNLRLKLWDIEAARGTLRTAMRHARIAVTSIDDNLVLLGFDDPQAIAAYYHNLGPDIVLVTLGADGCFLSLDGAPVRIPPAPATPVDSTGAGDSFAGSFLAWWLELDDAVEAAHRAAIVAAGTVSGLGAVTPIPNRVEVMAARQAS